MIRLKKAEVALKRRWEERRAAKLALDSFPGRSCLAFVNFFASELRRSTPSAWCKASDFAWAGKLLMLGACVPLASRLKLRRTTLESSLKDMALALELSNFEIRLRRDPLAGLLRRMSKLEGGSLLLPSIGSMVFRSNARRCRFSEQARLLRRN